MQQQLTFTTTDAAATEWLGQQIGARLRGGEIVELISDLGGGKTTLTRGLVAGAGSADQVASPTFTISRQYQAADFDIYHYDFYRLAEPGVMADELAEAAADGRTVLVIEWSAIVSRLLPTDRLIQITLIQQDDQTRQIIIKHPGPLNYLVDGVTLEPKAGPNED